MTMKARMRRLENAAPIREKGPCSWPYFTVLVDAGEPIPEGAGACPLCGDRTFWR